MDLRAFAGLLCRREQAMRGARIDVERSAIDVEVEFLAHLCGKLGRVLEDHLAFGFIHWRGAGRTQLKRMPVHVERPLLGELLETQRADETERADEVRPNIDAQGGDSHVLDSEITTK